MLKSINFFAVFLAAQAAGVSKEEFLGWNSLVSGKGIFDEEIDHLNYKSTVDSILLSSFKDLLNQQDVLDKVYGNYRRIFEITNGGSMYRKSVFKNHLMDIATHNLEAARGKHSWFKAVNQFTDMTDPEFKRLYTQDFSKFLNPIKIKDSSQNLKLTEKGPPSTFVDAPKYVNWREVGVVTRAKNQHECGSCCMFAATAALESAVAMATGDDPVALSPQQLVDCASPGFACDHGGSFPSDSITYLTKHGVATLEDYPYHPKHPPVVGPCQEKLKKVRSKIASSESGFSLNGTTLKYWVAQGPVMAGLVAPPPDFGKGILPASYCGTNATNHAVLVVGYGTEDPDKDYWLIKNSYGSHFGEHGFYRMERTQDEKRVCDLASWAYSVTADVR